MNPSEQDEAFAAIVSRLEDPEDRIDRRAIVADCMLRLVGSLLARAAQPDQAVNFGGSNPSLTLDDKGNV